MITSENDFFEIMHQGKSLEMYELPNGPVTLEVHSFIDKMLLSEELYQKKFEELSKLLRARNLGDQKK